MQHPKVVVIGAGSLFFGRQAIWQMTKSEHLNGGTLTLVDTEPAHLARMTALAKKAVEHSKVKLAIESSTNRRDVLADADFVVLSFADQSVKYRGIDCRIALKYGIRMCSGDTIGPGGIMRTLREFPVILECCKDIEELCPNAWVINYINPTAANGVGLRIFAPKLKSFALCDGLHMPHVKKYYAMRAGIIEKIEDFNDQIDRDFDMQVAGPNHFTWLVKAQYKGQDVTERIAETVSLRGQKEVEGGDVGAKALHNDRITYALFKAFGVLPMCTAHTKEYVRFWQGLGKLEEKISPLSIWETGDRYLRHFDMWNEVDGYNYGVKTMDEFYAAHKPDHATDIIEAIVGNTGKPFYVNTTNNGAVSNMPDDCFMELLCDVSANAIMPRRIDPMPVGVRGLCQQVLDTHELTARAAATGDRDMLYHAFCIDPLSNSLADSRAMIEDFLQAQKPVLPDYWFKS